MFCPVSKCGEDYSTENSLDFYQFCPHYLQDKTRRSSLVRVGGVSNVENVYRNAVSSRQTQGSLMTFERVKCMIDSVDKFLTGTPGFAAGRHQSSGVLP